MRPLYEQLKKQYYSSNDIGADLVLGIKITVSHIQGVDP